MIAAPAAACPAPVPAEVVAEAAPAPVAGCLGFGALLAALVTGADPVLPEGLSASTPEAPAPAGEDGEAGTDNRAVPADAAATWTALLLAVPLVPPPAPVPAPPDGPPAEAEAAPELRGPAAPPAEGNSVPAGPPLLPVPAPLLPVAPGPALAAAPDAPTARPSPTGEASVPAEMPGEPTGPRVADLALPERPAPPVAGESGPIGPAPGATGGTSPPFPVLPAATADAARPPSTPERVPQVRPARSAAAAAMDVAFAVPGEGVAAAPAAPAPAPERSAAASRPMEEVRGDPARGGEAAVLIVPAPRSDPEGREPLPERAPRRGEPFPAADHALDPAATGQEAIRFPDRLPATSAPPDTPEPLHPLNVERTVAAVRRAWEGGVEVRLTLHPESLGDVRVRLRWEGGSLTARLEAASPRACAALEGGLPALRTALEEHGIPVDALQVGLQLDLPGGGVGREPRQPAPSPEAPAAWSGPDETPEPSGGHLADSPPSTRGRLDIRV